MHPIDRVIELCPPAETSVDSLTVPEWIERFRGLGTRLPDHLLRINKTYGSGFFESIQSPVNASFGFYCYSISRYAITRLAELRLAKLKKPKAFPAALYFEPNGILPIGTIGGDIDICLRISGDNVDKWKISLLREKSNAIHDLNLSILEFTIAVLEGNLESPLFPKSLPSRKGYRFHSFREAVKCWHAG